MSEMEPCGVCHALHPLEDLQCFDDTLICPECLDNNVVLCTRCGERIWREDDQGDDVSGHLCQSCYDRYYNTCEECHRIICEEDAYYEDDDTVLCYDCHRRHRSRYSINDYSYKPDPIFYGADTLYMGVEIELDEGGESDNQARKLLEIANAESERIYCKHDGSLNDGFEVVSHPMTLEYHTKSMPWQAVLEKAKQLGYLSHQAKTCGLHIHVNRTAFGDNLCEQEEVIARILYFFEKHWEELLKCSRRTHRQMEQWANRYGYKDSPNPFCLYHYERLGVYIYASTEPILKTALKQLNLKLGKPTKVKLDCGEILKIDADGNMSRSQFDDSKIFMGYSHWPHYYSRPAVWEPVQDSQASYIEDLKSVAAYYGIYEDEIDEMLADGVTPEEIEELLNGA